MTPQDKKLHSKDALLEAAKHLFTEKGYEAVSTREIADAAKVNLGAIQYHFGSKAALFVEAVRGMMEGSHCVQAHQELQATFKSPEDAALGLKRFIASFLQYLLKSEGPQPCRLMFREVFTSTRQDPEMFEALTSTVVNEFIRPVDTALINVLGYLKPELQKAELEGACQSIIGQCTFYVTHGPFLERLRGVSLASKEQFEATVQHIFAFTLRGLGCEQDLLKKVLKA